MLSAPHVLPPHVSAVPDVDLHVPAAAVEGPAAVTALVYACIGQHSLHIMFVSIVSGTTSALQLLSVACTGQNVGFHADLSDVQIPQASSEAVPSDAAACDEGCVRRGRSLRLLVLTCS